MKIGEFAKKHNVTVDTVRYYISEGLLTPLRVGTQFNFSEIDSKAMDTILLLKSMNFKLEEMKAYLLFDTVITGGTFRSLGAFRSSFEEKLKQNKEEIEKLNHMNRLIEERLAKYNEKFRFKRGVSLNRIGKLLCPDCKKNLELHDPELLHNEVMTGSLTCPSCGRKYFIRYGMIADKEIPDFDDFTENVPEVLEKYLEKNDETYILNIRELFQHTAEIAKTGMPQSKNIMIIGGAAGFMNNAILRTMPADSHLFAVLDDNINLKYFLEDVFPNEATIYAGDVKNVPFDDEMDYIFWQNYDIDSYEKGKAAMYPHFHKDTVLECFKTLIFIENLLPDEKTFFADLKKLGFTPVSEVKTDHIIKKSGSSDLSIFGKDAEFEVQFGIYTFKTLS